MTYRIALLAVPFLSASCVISLADQTLKTEDRSFDGTGVTLARFETGSGSLSIRGVRGTANISVNAVYRGRSDSGRILDNLKLTTELRGGTFYLKSEQIDHFRWGNSGSIDLTITLPSRITLEIEDGSGSIDLSSMDSDVRIDDGSGSIEIRDVAGDLTIEDGSGSLDIRNAGKDVRIKDGSGGIDVRHVAGSVRINDGSGSIDVEDIDGDLDVPDDGSGSIHYRDVRGRVNVPLKKRRSY